MLLHRFLDESAGRHPEKVALVTGERRWTYGELVSMADSLARALREAGVGKGDRVVVHLGNSVEAVVSIYGILKTGGAFVMLHPTTKEDKLIHIVRDCGASGLISKGCQCLLNRVQQASGSLTSVVTVNGKKCGCSTESGGYKQQLWRDLVKDGKDGTGIRSIDVDLASLIYTSGSTGTPKGVMMTHRNMVAAVRSITEYVGNVPDDIIINVLPLSFDYGLYQVLMSVAVGTTLVLEKGFTYPYALVQRVVEEKVTGLPGIPTIFAILLKMEGLNPEVFDGVRYVTNTAAALPTNHIEGLVRLFRRARIFSMYGLTECKRVAYLPPDQLLRKPKSVGRAMPNLETFIVDEAGQELGPYEVGELVVRGATVMLGYWGMPRETAEILREGRYPGERVLYTGDLFYTDEDGYLYFVGRKDDIIKSRGEKVSPREVEDVLCQHDGVAEAGVVGVPDPVLGQAIKAVVVSRPGRSLTAKELKLWCARHLEDYMVPQIVEFRQEMPKSANGKIRRKALCGADDARPSRE